MSDKKTNIHHPCLLLGINPNNPKMGYLLTTQKDCESRSKIPRFIKFCSQCDSPWRICFSCARKGGSSDYKKIQSWISGLKSELEEKEAARRLFSGVNQSGFCSFHAYCGEEQPIPRSKEEMAAILFPEKFQAPTKTKTPAFGPMTESRRYYSPPLKCAGIGRTVSPEELEKIRIKEREGRQIKKGGEGLAQIQKKQKREAKKKLIALEAANVIAGLLVEKIKKINEEDLRLLFYGNGSAPEEISKEASDLRIAAEKIIELLKQNI